MIKVKFKEYSFSLCGDFFFNFIFYILLDSKND